MPVDRDFGDEPSEPIDRLVIALRAYVRRAPKKPKKGSKPPRTTLPGAVNWRDLAPKGNAQRLGLGVRLRDPYHARSAVRFGGYQLRYKGQVSERGAFYEPMFSARMRSRSFARSSMTRRSNSDGERIHLRTRAEFVEEVFYRIRHTPSARRSSVSIFPSISRAWRSAMRAPGAA